jgi:hypothetical protein
MGDDSAKLIRLVQQCDQERQRRIKAERQASMLRATLARVLAQQRTRDAKADDHAKARSGVG